MACDPFKSEILEFVLKCSTETLGGRQSEIKPRWKMLAVLETETQIDRGVLYASSTSVICLKTSKQES